MDINIRPVKIEDAPFINEMRRMDGVRENITGLITEKLSRSENFINNLTDNDQMLVAEIEKDGIKKVVGNINLHINTNLRTRHSASLGIMVHKDYQGMGIGRALIEKILDVADNWLMLVRIELGVFTDNEKAINFYKSVGFEIEGLRKYAIIRDGKYADDYIMARYRHI